MLVRFRPALITLLFALVAAPAYSADSKDIAASPQAKVYQAQMKAVAAGDYEAYKKTVSKATLAQMDKQMKEMKMDSKKSMEFMKMMMATDIKYTGLKVEGKKATLSVTGKMDGQPNKGTVEEVQEDGAWKIGEQSWTNAK